MLQRKSRTNTWVIKLPMEIPKGRSIRHFAALEHMTDKAFMGVVGTSRSSFMGLVVVCPILCIPWTQRNTHWNAIDPLSDLQQLLM